MSGTPGTPIDWQEPYLNPLYQDGGSYGDPVYVDTTEPGVDPALLQGRESGIYIDDIADVDYIQIYIPQNDRHVGRAIHQELHVTGQNYVYVQVPPTVGYGVNSCYIVEYYKYIAPVPLNYTMSGTNSVTINGTPITRQLSRSIQLPGRSRKELLYSQYWLVPTFKGYRYLRHRDTILEQRLPDRRRNIELIMNASTFTQVNGSDPLTNDIQLIVSVMATPITASATPIISNGTITGLNIVGGGSNYTTAPTITITSATGTGARATAIITRGIVTGYTGLVGGTGYLAGNTTVSIAPPTSQATATVTVTGGVITAITVTNGGAGYSSAYPPNISFTSSTGAGASATLTVANGRITGYTNLIGGYGYATVTATIDPPGVNTYYAQTTDWKRTADGIQWLTTAPPTQYLIMYRPCYYKEEVTYIPNSTELTVVNHRQLMPEQQLFNGLLYNPALTYPYPWIG